jgi:hypothetical protein
VETMVGIAVLLVGVGVLWVCLALGVYLFTRTGREGIRIQNMQEGRRPPRLDLDPKGPGKARPTREEEADAGGQPPPPTTTVKSLPTEPRPPTG